MINIDLAIEFHNDLIDDFGGSKGVRDIAGLEAAIARPYGSFAEQEFYPSPFEKAAAILESLIINHPFMDGNKRIAYLLMQLILIDYNFNITVDKEEQYKFVIAASTGQIRFDEIKVWIENHATAI